MSPRPASVVVPAPGRGTALNPANRFERLTVEADPDYAEFDEHGVPVERPHPRTQFYEDATETILNHYDSPDLGAGWSLNPYRGCEHGCVYCFARPSHAYLDLSPGLDFETRLFAKTNAAERLRHELAKPGYMPSPITLGINTDAYQPIERRYQVTRQCLQELAECGHPVTFVTKSALILRDLDLLVPMARRNLVSVHLSVTTLDNRLSSKLEPRAAAPHTRLSTIRALGEAGIPVGVLVAPVIPMVTDEHLEHILEAAHQAGARSAGYVLLRLPHELKEVWREWLELHYPERAAHVMSLVNQMRGGKDYDSAYGRRMRGEGPFADLIAMRFHKARRKLGFAGIAPLDCSRFVAPRKPSPQADLFAG